MVESVGSSAIREPVVRSSALFITFEPTDLPSGAVTFRDLSLFIRGLQRISDGIVQADYDPPDAGILLHAFRFVVIAQAPGSFKLVLALRPIVDTIQRAFGQGALSDARPEQLPGMFEKAADAIGSDNVDPVARRALSQQQELLGFFRDSHAQNLAKQRRRLERPETRRGLQYLWEVVKDPIRITASFSDRPDDLAPIVVDRRSLENARQPLNQIDPGPYVQVRGSVYSFNEEMSRFGLNVESLNSNIRCFYPDALRAAALPWLSARRVITVRGFSRYPIGAAPVPPPYDIDVREILSESDLQFQDYLEWPEPSAWLANGLPQRGTSIRI